MVHESPQGFELLCGGAELIPRVQMLWETLFDHHLTIGAAGIATIERSESWPLRRAHDERIFQDQPRGAIWIATDPSGAGIGYAFAYEDLLQGERAIVLETLSVRRESRGHGLGMNLMNAVADAAREWGIQREVVDVMGGNTRARDLYLRTGFVPFSETWMRSRPPGGAPPERTAAVAGLEGIECTLVPGPDDTWRSSAQMASLKFGEDPVSEPALMGLWDQLERNGVWTVFVEIPAAPRAGKIRRFLGSHGFRMSTERLLTRVKPQIPAKIAF